jgi:uncharacterized membrane protein HdeD (DUF308 family)
MTTTTTPMKNEPGLIPWWLVLLEGISLVILGLFFLSSPAQTAVIAVQVLGIYWLIAGIFRIISIFIDSSMWGLKLFAGILGIIAGILVLNHPIISTIILAKTIILILGIEGIIFGVIGIVQAFRGAGLGAGILGVVSLLFGALLLANSWGFALSLPWAIGLLAIVGGIASIIAAFRMK